MKLILASEGGRGRTSCVPLSTNCIICVPKCLLRLYQLRPELSVPRVRNTSVASQQLCLMCVIQRHKQTYRTDREAIPQRSKRHCTHTYTNTGKYEMLPAIKKLYHLRSNVSVSRVSSASELSTPNVTCCVPQLVGNCISCVPGCLLHAYLLCPESSTARV